MQQAEFDSLVSPRDPNRRDFVRTAVGGTFAAAVLPVAAQTVVTTDSAGLVAGEVTIPVGDFRMPAYRAAPANRPNAPLVLVVSEIFGVHAHIADVARRFAKAGCFAVAPQLFVRQGDAAAYTEIPRLISEVVSKVPDEQVMRDLDASVAWASGQGADTTKAGITGFCWGGRITWLYAAHSPQMKAGVAWYGRLVGDKTALQPMQPVELASQLRAPVLGLYGGQDSGIPLDSVERMKAALAGGSVAAKQSRFVVYPEAGHAFHADYRPSYRADAAQDGWKRALAWFAEHGVG
ncbi:MULTISPECIES: dienelactone hydrolase family protein [unclassified Rubrivivax]|uniref:dienelactone hydrolase family protein n=1 Tax=unclassified Rubrivivax TaxID=2649762 RepID=UPI001E3755C4|nr:MULTISPECIES: dienelactone hydrolase family protein [unclassified Rubrivivax]MCC9598147.1 dienelactone hydrolase family protein [Rubrivivax sp. JA1055]MCC9645596.1 dienelactone hydrolase family protein [Rubrivivax sp. JA1029]